MEPSYRYPPSLSVLNSIYNWSLQPFKSPDFCYTMAGTTASMILSPWPLRMRELNLCSLPGATLARTRPRFGLTFPAECLMESGIMWRSSTTTGKYH